MDMTGPGNSLLQRTLKILQEALRHTHPVRKIGSDHKVLTGVEIILHNPRMESDTSPVRFMRHYQPVPVAELRGNIYQLQILLQRKIILTGMTIDEQRFALCAEF